MFPPNLIKMEKCLLNIWFCFLLCQTSGRETKKTGGRRREGDLEGLEAPISGRTQGEGGTAQAAPGEQQRFEQSE